MNLTIAVMLMEYEKLDKNDSDSSHKKQLKEIAAQVDLPRALVDFIIRENLKVGSKAKMIDHDKKKNQTICEKIFATLPPPSAR